MPGYGSGSYGAGLYSVSAVGTSLSIQIAGTEYSTLAPDTIGYLNGSTAFVINDQIEERSTCEFTIYDENGEYYFKKGQSVVVTDAIEGVIFSGFVQSIKRTTDVWPHVWHDVLCTDKVSILDGHTSDIAYTLQYAGAIAVDQIKDEWANGIQASFAIDTDTTQADFAAGNLNGTVAASNIGDGDLELAPAGTSVTIIEQSTASFNTGTLNNVIAANNSLSPSTTISVQMVATQTVPENTSSFVAVKIWQGPVTIPTNSNYYWLSYDIWIESTSPTFQFGVDIIFTNGQRLQDNVAITDLQAVLASPSSDLSGLAKDTWYHRDIIIADSAGGFMGDTMAYLTLACAGNKAGTYTAYFKNITYSSSSSRTASLTPIFSFFSGGFEYAPPRVVQANGFASNTKLTLLNTIDALAPINASYPNTSSAPQLTSAYRISPSYSIDAVKIVKDSFITWQTYSPPNTQIQVWFSLDGGSSFTQCINNSPLPNLLAGMNMAGKTITFFEGFYQLPGADPSQPNTTQASDGSLVETYLGLIYLECIFNPSYAASKTDVLFSTATGWSGGTLNNTVDTSGVLSLVGATRNWDDALITNQTIFAIAYGTDPNVGAISDNKTLFMQIDNNDAITSRMDFAGTYSAGVIDVDIYLNAAATATTIGVSYHTTAWSSYDNNFAYAVEVSMTAITLYKGSNRSTASNGTKTQLATATLSIASASWHHLQVVFGSGTHTISLDDEQLLTSSDATYTGAGYIGLRLYNTNTGYAQGYWDNFGIVHALSGSYMSSALSLSSAATYGNSVVSWADFSSNPALVTVVVQAKIGSGSYATCINGQAIPGLTAGQSLSGVTLTFQITLTTTTASAIPGIGYFNATILGQFNSLGTRINKALLLAPAGICGSTLVAWNAITPANTSVSFATSLDGVTYTSVSSGGSIAGINEQPGPSIDTFNLISSGDYSSTARTGGTTTSWVWDTTNSRLTVSGGTNALLLYGAISVSDVDIVFDLDEADNSGVVWRWASASNYYELLVYDGSSSAGATNVARLYKVVSNVKTQIGSDIPITLVRGQIVKRARVTHIGTSITVYFDGATIASTTDSALAGPGQVGFSNVSGVARFYTLRIQPQGDNLSGKQVYVKQTLTSSDPTQTPQITDMTTLVTNPNIGVGSLIATANYANTYKSDNIKNVASQSNYYWDIRGSDSAFIFIPRETLPAPWVLTNQDIMPGQMEVDDTADLYRNRHTMTGVISTIAISEQKIGDGKSTSWTLQYSVASLSSITLDGIAQTFGLKGTTGYDFYYAVGDNSIAQDSSGTVLEETDTLVIAYTGQTTTTVTRDNTGEFAGTISQRQYIDQSDLSIPVQTILNQAASPVSSSGTSNDLDVSLVRHIAIDINVTAQSGTSPTVQFFVDRKGADGNYYQIWSSSVLSSTGTVSTTIGPKCTVKEVLGLTCRLRWTIGGSGGPSSTFSISIQGRVDPSFADIGVVEVVEDVSSLLIDVPTAQARGDAALQEWGVQGRTFKFETRRTGLTVGQDLAVYLPNMGINNASMLITSIQRNQQWKSTAGQPDQTYIFTVTASEGPVLTSWANTMNKALKGAI
jgi:hypothetical protein